MKQNNQDKMVFIDIELHESEIKDGISDITRCCAEKYLIKASYILKLHKFFIKNIETIAEKIYNKILLEKELKNHKFSKSNGKELIESEIRQLPDKYIMLIPQHSENGLYSKYNISKEEKTSLRVKLERECDEQSKKLDVKYRNLLKEKNNESKKWMKELPKKFIKWLFCAVLTIALGIYVPFFLPDISTLKSLVNNAMCNLNSINHQSLKLQRCST